MNLYTQKEKNIRKTWFLIFLFFCFIIFLGWFLSYYFNNRFILYFAVILSLVLNFYSYWNSDKIVLNLTKAKPVEFKDNPELYRIVENLSITAGLPMPKIYILEEDIPNAFATGRNPKKGVVVVTKGLLEKLDRSELEGVIAHELTHIGNYDTLIQTISVVFVSFVTILSDIFLRVRINNNKNKNINSLIFIFGIFVLILAPIFARILHFAVSRKREFLADAGGAILTRYPEGLIRALEKISNDNSQIKNIPSSTAHLFFANPFLRKNFKNKEEISSFQNKENKTPFLIKLFMTHPPIEERIKALRGIEIK